MHSLEVKLEKYNQRHRLIAPVQSVLLAVSGGVDSMVMLHLFSRVRERLKLKLSVIHVNHQLRGEESMGDEKFVMEMSNFYHIPFSCERIDVMSYAHELGLSKQLAARCLRYECFERIRVQAGTDTVATAHHADDNAETVLLNIMRGTGIHGLAGIPPKRETGCIIRPLLFATRKEIETYAVEQGITYRNDSSNRSLAYRRNELRHNILPILQKSHPKIVKTLNQIAGTMLDVNEKMRRIVDETMRALIQKDPQGRLTLHVEKLKLEPDFLWDEIFVEVLHRLGIEPTEKKVSALHRLCTQPTGRSVELGSRFASYHDREYVVFKITDDEQLKSRKVEFGKSYDYKNCLISISTPERVPSAFAGTHEVEYIDAERLGQQLVLRTWQSGDWFIPLGMKTKKKLSDFFTDQKVPRYQKSSIPVLESDGTIVWICGKRLDDRFKLTDRTHTAIRLTCQPSTRAHHV
ncbi:MAG: tRNA lysidine(34) synthetase TilS [Ignavibacteriales bacterium]|nr:tRNA lysidine(34) synthetase TilS [Ignavibacteriales bacterium]